MTQEYFISPLKFTDIVWSPFSWNSLTFFLEGFGRCKRKGVDGKQLCFCKNWLWAWWSELSVSLLNSAALLPKKKQMKQEVRPHQSSDRVCNSALRLGNCWKPRSRSRWGLRNLGSLRKRQLYLAVANAVARIDWHLSQSPLSCLCQLIHRHYVRKHFASNFRITWRVVNHWLYKLPACWIESALCKCRSSICKATWWQQCWLSLRLVIISGLIKQLIN